MVGLLYPGHVATAVQFGDQIPGDGVICDGTRYAVCDPTYMGAAAGMCMPQFAGVKPELIRMQ